MNRRRFLATIAVATTSAAGCLGSEEQRATEGDDSSPIDAAPADLTLSVSELDTGWQLTDEVSLTDDHRRNEFFNQSEEANVDSAAWVFETVEEAESEFAAKRDDVESRYSIEDHEIAVEGFYYQPAEATVYFRDANAIGRITHMVDNSTGLDSDEELALDLAVTMHEDWR